MSQVDFYLISNNVNNAKLKMAGRLSNKLHKLNLKTLVCFENKAHAVEFDELLWTLSDASFVPHDLIIGETEPCSFSKIHIIYTDLVPEDENYDVLLNMCPEVPASNTEFNRIAEIVSHEDTEKALARERFKVYKSNGDELKTHSIAL